jgi:anthranilate synthase/aminodeoxychorismate synthase-like glutamine amidotransferase
MILVIDNYDSFTYNLVQYIGELCLTHKKLSQEIKVFRNDKISIDKINKLKPKYIIISPGPCTPKEAGISVSVIKNFAGKIPILGVCLGHECIVETFGGKITRSPEIFHGKVSKIFHDEKTIYKNLPNPFLATRYHSLVAEKKSLPKCLEITSWTDKGIIMGVRIKNSCLKIGPAPVEGVQFHPESIMTLEGKKLLLNFFNLTF